MINLSFTKYPKTYRFHRELSNSIALFQDFEGISIQFQSEFRFTF